MYEQEAGRLPGRILIIKSYLYISVLVFLMMSALAGCDNAGSALPPPEMKPGYYHAGYEGLTDKGAAFLVCGTGGRLDRVYEDGVLENIPLPIGDKDLTSVFVGEDITLVGGLSGALVYSRDGKSFESSKGTGGEHTMGLTQFAGRYYACTNSGKILSSADGMSWITGKQLADKPLIAIAANDSNIMAITQDTDIFISADGNNWESKNYNEIYYGLAESQTFLNIVNLGESFYILGDTYENPGAPAIMYSYDSGESWMYVVSREINDRPPEEFYPIRAYSACLFGGDLLAACSGGRVLTYTDCPSCNKISETSAADLRCIVNNDSIVLVAGDNFEYAMLTAEDFLNSGVSTD